MNKGDDIIFVTINLKTGTFYPHLERLPNRGFVDLKYRRSSAPGDVSTNKRLGMYWRENQTSTYTWADIEDLLIVWNLIHNTIWVYLNDENTIEKVEERWSKDPALRFLNCRDFTQYDQSKQKWKPI